MLTTTSLTHPTMAKRLRRAIYLARSGYGHLMNGHGNRVYLQNRHGQNIIRISCINGEIIAYGEESKNITAVVMQALKRSNPHNFLFPGDPFNSFK